MITPVESSYTLRPVWYLSALGLLTALLYSSAIMDLAAVWARNEDYNHGFLVIPISLYLVWRKKGQLLHQPLQSSSLGIFFLSLWAALYLLGVGAQILTFEYCSLIVFLVGTLLVTIGIHATRIVLFPVMFLLFMVPIPSEIYTLLTGPLQLFTTGFSACVLNLFHIPVMREGTLIHLPNYSMQVVVACSGLRSLISVAALSLLMGYLFFSSNIERAVLLLVSIPVAVIGNILRITITGFMVYQGFPYTAGDFFHTVAGMSTFCLPFFLLLGSMFFLRWIERKRMQYISWFLR